MALFSDSDEQSNSGMGWTGFKIVGDNIDRNVRPSYQRVYQQTQSLHHFHAMAVQDRVDLSVSSTSTIPTQPVDPDSLLLTSEDVCHLKEDFRVLLSR